MLPTLKVLVADDDPIVRAIVQRVVSQSAHDFMEAEDGLDALRMIENDDPDVLVTDLRMPIIDGFELVSSVRRSPRHRGMPIICLSAVQDRDAIARLAALGITDYLLKPIRSRDLLERLKAVAIKYAAWKSDRNSVSAGAEAPIVLVIDPDIAFRSFVATALAPDFGVIEAATGASGVIVFRAESERITTVLVSEGLDLMNEQRVAELVRSLATAQGATPPNVLLLTAANDVSPEKAANFDGVVRRSNQPGEFAAGVERWLPKAAV